MKKLAMLVVIVGLAFGLSGCGWMMDKFTCAFGGYAAEGHGC